ncbi:MAG TPA: TerC family protein [Bacillota bacterium]|nr:TerC family protein [Bacillota bacterium]
MEITQTSVLVLLKIIAIDIVLSGDKAVFITLATKSLPKKARNKAILLGTVGAVILRIILAILILYLFHFPYLRLIGGVLLLWVAYNLLIEKPEKVKNVNASSNMLKVVCTIIIADAIMSLDNVVGIAAAANGHIGMIIIGVAISIPIMVLGSKPITRVMNKHRWIVYLGAAIIAWTAGDMMTKDKYVTQTLDMRDGIWVFLFVASLTLIILLLGMLRNSQDVDGEKS